MAPIKEILSQPDFSKVRAELTKNALGTKYDEIVKQYDATKHEVTDTGKRPNKLIQKDGGSSSVDVARLPIPFQKLIVNRAVAFLIGNGIKLNAQPENDQQTAVLTMLNKIISTNKLQYRDKQISRTLMSECEAAELWYYTLEEGVWNKLKALLKLGDIKVNTRMKILSPSRGDKLYPHFDEYGSMDAFSREYSTIENGNAVIHFDVYTDEVSYRYIQKDGSWSLLEKPTKNIAGKIPVIYYSQPTPEWNEVQNLIDRLEKLISNFADSNDYFGSPLIKVKGEIEGFAGKGESGKILLLKEGAEADYLTWDQAPEAIKLEIETLQNLIFSASQTPDISFSQMKNLGNISGIALKMMFMDAHLKASIKEEVFGEGVQRRLNLLKTIIGKVISVKLEAEADMLEVTPEFNYFLPRNEKEEVETLMAATGGKAIMSQKAAVERNPFVNDVEAEMAAIQEEEKAALSATVTGGVNY